MTKPICLVLVIVAASVTCYAEGKYRKINVDQIQNSASMAPDEDQQTKLIRLSVEDALGKESQYKSKKQRVLSVNSIEQVAGKNKGKVLVQVAYLSDPALIGPKNVTKDGLLIDAVRVAESVFTNPKLKSMSISELMFMTHVVSAGGKIEQVMKIVIPYSAFKKVDWSKIDGATFEAEVRTKGSMNISPFLIQNGGKHLILKPEQLDL